MFYYAKQHAPLMISPPLYSFPALFPQRFISSHCLRQSPCCSVGLFVIATYNLDKIVPKVLDIIINQPEAISMICKGRKETYVGDKWKAYVPEIKKTLCIGNTLL